MAYEFTKPNPDGTFKVTRVKEILGAVGNNGQELPLWRLGEVLDK